MAKSSFSLVYEQGGIVFHGITSIMPNLNGILLQTEDRENVQLDCDELCGANFEFKYYDFKRYTIPDGYIIMDHRTSHTE